MRGRLGSGARRFHLHIKERRKVVKENAENKKNGLKLEDEALEGVSGGCLKSQCVSKCIYCGVSHLMTRYSPVAVRYDNTVFRNCERYLCNRVGCCFYIVNDYGIQLYLDQWLNEKGTP